MCDEVFPFPFNLQRGFKEFSLMPCKPQQMRLGENHYCYGLNLMCWCSAVLRIKNKEGSIVLFWCDCKVVVSNAVSLAI